MLLQHFILGLPADATDEEIRSRYLELVKKHPPEKAPERFRQITNAYESIRTKRQRINEQLFSNQMARTYEENFKMMAQAKEIKRRRVGLQELLKAEKHV